jgi:ADP-ribosylglycohydrolase
MARNRIGKEQIRARIAEEFGYDLNRSVDSIRPKYAFDISCQGTVPEAIVSFLDSESFEDAVRNAVSLGGDSDTLACITGGIAGAYYGVPDRIRNEVENRLTPDLLNITMDFCRKHVKNF